MHGLPLTGSAALHLSTQKSDQQTQEYCESSEEVNSPQIKYPSNAHD